MSHMDESAFAAVDLPECVSCGNRPERHPKNGRQFWYNGGQLDKEKDSVGTGVRFMG